MLFLDKKNQLIADEVVGRGTVDHAPLYPRELMRHLTRRHGDLWRRIVALGRAQGETPAAMLYRALEAGCETIEACAEPGRRAAS